LIVCCLCHALLCPVLSEGEALRLEQTTARQHSGAQQQYENFLFLDQLTCKPVYISFFPCFTRTRRCAGPSKEKNYHTCYPVYISFLPLPVPDVVQALQRRTAATHLTRFMFPSFLPLPVPDVVQALQRRRAASGLRRGAPHSAEARGVLDL
jgi:hypothetical protein